MAADAARGKEENNYAAGNGKGLKRVRQQCQVSYFCSDKKLNGNFL